MTATITQLRDTHTDPAGNTYDRWAFTTDGTVIAELLADPTTHEITWIWTADQHREQGHSTALYTIARAETPIRHAPETHRTDDGNRFAERVGGPTMPDCTTCCAHLTDDEAGES